MRMNIKMDTEDERTTDIPEEVTELDNSMEHIIDVNTRLSIISKILNTLLITQWCNLKVINIPEVWFVVQLL